MAYALILMVAIIILILYVLQPGTQFQFSAFGKNYEFTVTSTSTSG
jgi:preprotein translocase subunit SecG